MSGFTDSLIRPETGTVNEKYCFIQDNDSHWYCIPIGFRRKFYLWAYEEADEEIFENFEKYRLQKHPSAYCFENLREIK